MAILLKNPVKPAGSENGLHFPSGKSEPDNDEILCPQMHRQQLI